MDSDTDLSEYHVVDGRSQDLGPVQYVWRDPEGEPEFVGVHAGTFGRTHLVPLRAARISPQDKIIHVPFHSDTIRSTRHLSPGADLTSQDRWELYQNYDLQPPAPGAPSPAEAEQGETGAGPGEDDLELPAAGK